jgi:hypothetical protein
LKEGEYISSIFCGWFTTFIRTQKGRIYCTVAKKERRRKASEKERDHEEESCNSN